MTFQQAIETQPLWVQLWVNWLGLAFIASVIVLLISKATRRDALIIAAVFAATIPFMLWLYSEVGYVRLLGLPHVILWTPLAVYLGARAFSGAISTPYRQVMLMLLATICVSLMFDYADVARFLMGETESMIPTGAPAGQS